MTSAAGRLLALVLVVAVLVSACDGSAGKATPQDAPHDAGIGSRADGVPPPPTDADRRVPPDAARDARAASDAAGGCAYFRVARDFIESEFCTGSVDNPALCTPYLEAYEGTSDGVVLTVEQRDFENGSPIGSADYRVRGTYYILTFVKQGGTALIVILEGGCVFGEMTYMNGGPGKYLWVTADEAIELLRSSLGTAMPAHEEPRLVWYPAPECSYSRFAPLWMVASKAVTGQEWYIDQWGKVHTEIVRPLAGG